MARYNTILETIGKTPIVKLNKLSPPGVNIYAKIEAFNPMGSVKDRMALAVIEDAEWSGQLKPGQTVIEATSGNTGIGLAMVCAQKGYPLVLTMAESFSVERRKLLRFLGAKVVLTPASEKGTGMLNKAIELADKHGYFLCKQFENQINADIHTVTTAQEILDDFNDIPLHYWVSGFGTGGTLRGVSRGLKRANRGIRVVVAEPDNSALLSSGIAQPKNWNGDISGSHPAFRPHLMQGWVPDFVSPLVEAAVESGYIDQIVPVAGAHALDYSRSLANQEGIFAGTSSGATLAAAIEIAKTAPKGTNILCMLPDTGERYLSTPLFGDISDDMSSEELSLSNSTAGYQFRSADSAVKNPAVIETIKMPAMKTVAAYKESQPSVDEIQSIIDGSPVVLFALEWCEFCWSIRKLFTSLNIDYTSIDLDSVRYQKNNEGMKLRASLKQHCGISTIPQIYVGGKHIGGATEVFEALGCGDLYLALSKAKVTYVKNDSIDAASFMPGWLHPRQSA